MGTVLVGARELATYQKNPGVILVDLREREDYRKEHLAGAINIPYDELVNSMKTLPKDKLIILCCYYGNHSLRATRLMEKEGYRIASLTGGYQAVKELTGN